MTELTPFPAGTIVLRKGNPTNEGVITSALPRRIGKKIKQTVQWTNGALDEVSIATLELKQTQVQTTLSLIESGIYGKRLALSDSLVHFRLSGSLQDMIYSMNLTNTEFFAYQFKPLLTFFNSFNNSLLIADEVGLGKTIEAGLIWTELTMREQAQRLLVVCPAPLCEKWQFELQSKFGVTSEIVNARTLLQSIRQIASGMRRAGVFITSYEQVRPPRGWNDLNEREILESSRAALAQCLDDKNLRDDVFQMLIVDEAHRVRNEQSQQHKGVLALRGISENTLFLSATPIQTGNENLYSLLKILDPTTYPYPEALTQVIDMNKPLVSLESLIANSEVSVDELKRNLKDIQNRRFVFGADLTGIDALLKENITDADLHEKKFRVELINCIGQLNPLNRIMTRTLKRDVQDRRVVRNPIVCPIQLTEKERKYYDAVTVAVQRYCEHSDLPVGFILTFSQQMMSSSLPASLRYWENMQISRESPDFLDVVDEGACESDDDDMEQQADSILAALRDTASHFLQTEGKLEGDSKLDALIQVIHNQFGVEGSKKVLVFSFYKATLGYLEERLSNCGIRCARVDGSISRQERQLIVNQFKEGAFPVLLCSEVMSEGVDLQFVDCMVNYDLPWNPAKIEQRIGRIDRIGQKSPSITIINFYYEGTIEERIYKRLLNRLKVFTETLGVAEEVLGKVIEDLQKSLFSKQLTPRQQEEQLERAKMAIERCRQQGEEAKGNSFVYQMMNEQIQDARRLQRYVTGENLKAYVESYCRRDSGGSRLVRKHDDLYGLELSSHARASFEQFLLERESSLETTDLLSNPSLELRFINKRAPEPRGIERVTQGHPLIRFISAITTQESISKDKTAALSLICASNEAGVYSKIPKGIYAYSAQLWTVELKGLLKRRSKIGYVAINMKTQEPLSDEQAEILVTHAASYGQDIVNFRNFPAEDTILETVSDAEDLMHTKFESYHDAVLLRAQEEALMTKSINQNKLMDLSRHYEEQLEKLLQQEKNNVAGVKGRRVKIENAFSKKKQDYEDRIASAELAMTELKNTHVTFSSGIIEFRDAL